jgi:signal transduction histidine kinase
VTGGFGLIGMRERVRAVAGKLEVRSEPGKGTVVWARIPVHDLDRGGDMTTTTDPGNTTDPGEGSR